MSWGPPRANSFRDEVGVKIPPKSQWPLCLGKLWCCWGKSFASKPCWVLPTCSHWVPVYCLWMGISALRVTWFPWEPKNPGAALQKEGLGGGVASRSDKFKTLGVPLSRGSSLCPRLHCQYSLVTETYTNSSAQSKGCAPLSGQNHSLWHSWGWKGKDLTCLDVKAFTPATVINFIPC